jgi:hypothetical protein
MGEGAAKQRLFFSVEQPGEAPRHRRVLTSTGRTHSFTCQRGPAVPTPGDLLAQQMTCREKSSAPSC